MKFLSVLLLILAAVLPHATGQRFFGFTSAGNKKAPATLASDPANEMALRAVEKQLSLQTGKCASIWSDELSHLCPDGGYMAMLENRFPIVGPFCRPAGCLYAAGHKGRAAPALDEGTILRMATKEEATRLVAAKPGTSFPRHLASLRKDFVKGSSLCVATISELLGQAPPEVVSFTTLRFFALQAEHRGFSGREVDTAWSALVQHEAEATFSTVARRVARETMSRARRVVVAVAGKTMIQEVQLLQGQRKVADLQAKVPECERLLDEEQAGRAEGLAKIVQQEEKIDTLRAEAASDRKVAPDGAAHVEEKLMSECELVAKLFPRAEAAEREATDQTSTIRDQKKFNTDTLAELAACDLLVETKREHAAVSLAAVQADLASQTVLLATVLGVAEAMERILEARKANVSCLDSVEASLRAEIQTAEMRAQEEERRTQILRDELIAAREKSQANFENWEAERAETRAEYVKAISTAKRMQELLAVLREEGQARQMLSQSLRRP